MRLLLDAHIFIWACAQPHSLSGAQRDAISSGDDKIFVSAASAWEIAIKHALGRLSFPLERFGEFLSAMGFEPLSIMPTHGIAAGGLPRHHEDPFDRMLIAQAQIDGLTIMTLDRKFALYQVPVFGLAAG